MKNITAKLLAVQKEMKPIEKDSTNPHFKSRYFDINGLLAALKPVLSKHGLVVIQPLKFIGERNILATIVMDSEDETHENQIVSEVALPEGLDPQKLGAAISYFRRYALTSLFALAGEDDDANEASAPSSKDFVLTERTYNAGAKCSTCGASMTISKTTGKPYCVDKCWLKQKEESEQIVPTVEIPF